MGGIRDCLSDVASHHDLTIPTCSIVAEQGRERTACQLSQLPTDAREETKSLRFCTAPSKANYAHCCPFYGQVHSLFKKTRSAHDARPSAGEPFVALCLS